MVLKYTIKQFQTQFTTDDACLEFLKDSRWPDGIHCETCQQVTKHHKVTSRRSYSCDRCGHHVHPTAGTIFHKSSTPLTSWFYAMYIIAATRCGISAKQLQRELGVTYKTAWRMFKEIRKLMDEDLSPFTGQVEVDETYIGGKRKGKRGRGAAGKTVAAGVVQRGGQVKAVVVPNVKKATLLPIVHKYVIPTGTTTVFTDELASYNDLAKSGYNHERIKHSSHVYVSGTAHTNTIEGFWSLVKRGINGVYHSVSSQHLQSYLNEYSFRYNHRDDMEPMFSVLVSQIPAHASSTARRS